MFVISVVKNVKKISVVLGFYFIVACTGCSFFGDKNSPKLLNSKSSPNTSLEVPPNLIKPAADSKYNIPASGEARLSDFNNVNETTFLKQTSKLLPVETDAYLVSYGGFKVLFVKEEPEELWGLLKDFWIRNGFQIEKEVPETGFIETNWLETKRNIPDGLIRNTLGKIFDGLYDTGERNKFRMRIERTKDGFSEISVVNKGLIQVASDDRFEPTVVWANKNSDQQLEELYLRKIISFITAKGQDNDESIALVDRSSSVIKGDNNDNFIELDLKFDAAWKSVGMVMDRLGFEVEERIKPKGEYLIRYKRLNDERKEKGFFAKIFSSKNEEVDMNVYRIQVKEYENVSRIYVSDYESNERSKSSQKILAVIFEQLN